MVAEVNPASEAIIQLDADGNISIDGAPVDLEGLRLQLPNAKSSLFVLHVDNQCRFEHVSRVLSVFDEVGIERPTFTVSDEE
jgi:biopolymer transport protein ExbD